MNSRCAFAVFRISSPRRRAAILIEEAEPIAPGAVDKKRAEQRSITADNVSRFHPVTGRHLTVLRTRALCVRALFVSAFSCRVRNGGTLGR